MAVIWQCRIQDDSYEIRSAGRTRRLYTNGVLHSQYNPRGFCGGVWDLLWLPALLLPRPAARVLVLGVGGGGVLRQLGDVLPSSEIVGVDVDALHLTIARRFFGLSGVSLIRAEAQSWLRAYRGPRFDLIVDDLFSHVGGVPQRAVEVDSRWWRLLSRSTRRDGVLVINFACATELSACVDRFNDRAQFQRAFALTTSHYGNAVAAFFGLPATTRQLRKRLTDLSLAKPGPRYRARRLP